MVTPIETRYAGHRFRSRLEARWAVFFDAMGIPWEYEPQGYALESGYYLPDFRIHLGDGPVFFEVKPTYQLEDPMSSDGRWEDLSHKSRLFVSGDIPSYYGISDFTWDSELMWKYEHGGWDNCHRFCVCESCGAVGIEYCGAWGRVECCKKSDGNDSPNSDDHKRIAAAFQCAREARFEHGESP